MQVMLAQNFSVLVKIGKVFSRHLTLFWRHFQRYFWVTFGQTSCLFCPN